MKRTCKCFLKDVFSSSRSGAYASYDVVGDIAIIRIHKSVQIYCNVLAEVIMQHHRNIKTVLQQTSSVKGDFRLRQLKWIAGEKKTITVHSESNCSFKVDLGKCYFSPRLSHERMRIARLVQPNEIVVNMFAGVGTYSILIAKYSGIKIVYSIDINPCAFKFMRENIRRNRVEDKVVPILGDAKFIILKRLQNVADRVVMPLPEKSYQYLDLAIMALKSRGGWLHYYDFEHASKKEEPREKTETKIVEKLQALGIENISSSSRVVRMTGPRWYQIVLDVHLGRKSRIKSKDAVCPFKARGVSLARFDNR